MLSEKEVARLEHVASSHRRLVNQHTVAVVSRYMLRDIERWKYEQLSTDGSMCNEDDLSVSLTGSSDLLFYNKLNVSKVSRKLFIIIIRLTHIHIRKI